MTTREWFDRVRGDDTVNAVAEKSGIVQSTLLRQLQRGHLGIVEAIKIARAYSQNPLTPLLEAGHITEDDLRSWRAQGALADATDREIADEVWRRLVDGSATADLSEPLDERPSLSVVTDINAGAGEPIAALRSERNKEFETRESE